MIGYYIALLSVACMASGFSVARRSVQLSIVGGNVTDIKEVPYTAAALKSGKLLECGASIISSEFLLTAAHCCVGQPPSLYRVGSNYYKKEGTLVRPSQVFIHPNYTVNPFPVYDVCIVRTSSPISFKETVQPVSIASEEPSPGDLVQVAGWGITEEEKLSPDLRSVQVPIIDVKYCSKAYPELLDMSTVICAGAKGKDSCQGDSGGGLTFNGNLLGIVSFGYGCGLPGYPGVYANVLNPKIRRFIYEITGV